MTRSHIGKTLWIAMAQPATHDAAGFAALTWVKVNGVQTLPQLGQDHNNIDVPDLESGEVMGLKGAATGRDSVASFRTVANDTGQGNVRTLAEPPSDGLSSIRITRATGAAGAPQAGDEVEYAKGYFHSFTPIQGDDSTHEGFSVNFKQNGRTISATFPA